jgi:aromatic ring-opening dioxygenase catalytic subunit (LigB family)
MPVVFLNHGLPTYFLSQPITGNPVFVEFRRGSETHRSLERIPKEINGENPTAIVIISAHWNRYEY